MEAIFKNRKAYAERQHPYDFEPTVSITQENIAGVNCYWFTPEHAVADKVILFAHGGGFAMGSFTSHGKMTSHLAKELSTKVLFVEYALAPEHPFPAGIHDLVQVYQYLLQHYPAQQIYVIGDSAGASLLVSAIGVMADLELALPHAVVLISPWIYLEGTLPSIAANAHLDFSISKDMLEMFATAYSGNAPLEVASPGSIQFRAFPPVLIMVGTHEILLDDSKHFYNYIKGIQPRARLSIYEEQPHVWLKKDVLKPASVQALAEIAAFIGE